MIAFTRFDSSPILERGMISSPDLVVIADASLLDDPLVRPLQGLSAGGQVLVNSTRPLESTAAVAGDFTGLALSHAGSASALSVALGAGAAKLAGLEMRCVEEAVLEELRELKLDSSRIEKNLSLARACFAAVAAPAEAVPEIAGPPPKAPVESRTVRIVVPAYDGPWMGTASVASAPNTPLRKTGDWRVMRPIIDPERCTHCWICFVHCPDGAITLAAGDVPQIDYGVCKGCLICVEECPIMAIGSVREAEVQ